MGQKCNGILRLEIQFELLQGIASMAVRMSYCLEVYIMDIFLLICHRCGVLRYRSVIYFCFIGSVIDLL